MNIEITTDIIQKANGWQETNKNHECFLKVGGTWSWKADAGKQQWEAMKPSWHDQMTDRKEIWFYVVYKII